ncbi:AAA family ATPase [Streptomyces fuscichromogenes]|uniref:helix-turn-helix transcriptional regulator n=1 Tax=Streptomyces fuscichromogenes TaxID=1324013 RepID=UPI00381B1B52
MEKHRGPVIGRDSEVREVAEALRATGISAGVLLVTADAGMGKTAVVEQARRAAAAEGARVLRLGWEGTEGTVDVTLVSDAGRGLVVKNLDDCPLRLTGMRRAQPRAAERDGERDGEATEQSVLSELSALGKALAEASGRAPYALVVDGIERMPRNIAEDLGLFLRIFRPPGIPVVMASRPGPTADAGRSQLLAAADRVLELPPLRPADVATLVAVHVAGRFGRPPEPALADAVSRALGTLQGNPRAVLSVLDSLDERDLLELDGQLCLTIAERQLRLATRLDELLRFGWPDAPAHPETVEAAIVMARVLDQAEVRFDDVLRMQPSIDAQTIERKLDRLVGDRVLTADQDGRLSFAVPALAAALRTLPTWRDVPGVYARIVTPVTDRLGAEAAGSVYSRLADHVAAAGPQLDDELAVPLLLAAAREDARTNWPASVRAYSSVLHRLAPQDPRTPSVLHAAGNLSLRHGDHSGLLAIGEPLIACLQATRPENAENPDSTEHDDGLETVAGAWVLAALHEHRSPYADDADPRYREVLERVPTAAELAALGGLYGIGPLASRPGPAANLARGTGPKICSGPLPSRAELRLMAAALGSHAELRRARQALPPDAVDERALGRLRNAAAYGDLAGAFAAVLGDRYVAAEDSAATLYRGMVRDFLAGDWEAALSAARRIEVRSVPDGTAGAAHLARAMAAEIHCARGDLERGRAWLERIPDTVHHPLVTRAQVAVRYLAGQPEEALEQAWHDVRQSRKSGLLAGVERVLLRLLWIAVYEDRPQTTLDVLEELEALHEEMATRTTREAVLIGRGMAYRDVDSVSTAYEMLKRRGDVPLGVMCCVWLADVADDPRPWLTEATQSVHRLGMGQYFRTEIVRAAQRRKVSVPRLRPSREELTELQVTLLRMVSDGATNRQIAVSLACSEKTVEQRLTKLFRRTGCRSRAELAAAWLDGGLARLGLLPEDSAGTRPRSGRNRPDGSADR